MVRTMEANKYFVGKDRVNVGSLLMVVLQVRFSSNLASRIFSKSENL